MKNETIEEFIEKECYEEGTSSPHIWSDGARAGAKWQAERMYSEEDMREYAVFCINCHENKMPCLAPKDWKEQFKKEKQ
jgi:hypothetical protein